MTENYDTKMKVTDLMNELKLRDLPITGTKTELQELSALIDEDISLEDTAISGEDLLMDVLTDEEEKAILTLPADENELLKSPISELNRSFSTDKPVDVPVAAANKSVLKRTISITPLTTKTLGVVKDELVPDAKPKQVIKVSAFTLEERLQLRAKKFGMKKSMWSSLNPNAASVGAGLKDVEPKQIGTLEPAAKNATIHAKPKQVINVSPFTLEERLQLRAKKFGMKKSMWSSLNPNAASVGAGLKDVEPKQIGTLEPAAKRATIHAKPKLVINASAFTLEERLQLRAKKFGMKKSMWSSLNPIAASVGAGLKDVEPKQIGTLEPAAKNATIHAKPKQVINVSAFTLEERLQLRAKKFGMKKSMWSSLNPNAASVGAGLKDVEPKQIGTLEPAAKNATIHAKPKQVINVSAFTLEERLQLRAKKFGMKKSMWSSLNPIAASVGAGLKDVEPKQIGTLEPAAKNATIHTKPKQVINVSAFTLEERLQLRAKKFGMKKSMWSSLNLNTASVGAGLKDIEPKQIGTLEPAAKRAKIHAKPKQVIKVPPLTLEERRQMRAKKYKWISSNLNTASVGAGLKNVNPKQIETLKKRAEEFGCMVSSTVARIRAYQLKLRDLPITGNKTELQERLQVALTVEDLPVDVPIDAPKKSVLTIAKITADERLEKMKQRFGDLSTIDSGKATSAGKDAYAIRR